MTVSTGLRTSLDDTGNKLMHHCPNDCVSWCRLTRLPALPRWLRAGAGYPQRRPLPDRLKASMGSGAGWANVPTWLGSGATP